MNLEELIDEVETPAHNRDADAHIPTATVDDIVWVDSVAEFDAISLPTPDKILASHLHRSEVYDMFYGRLAPRCVLDSAKVRLSDVSSILSKLTENYNMSIFRFCTTPDCVEISAIDINGRIVVEFSDTYDQHRRVQASITFLNVKKNKDSVSEIVKIIDDMEHNPISDDNKFRMIASDARRGLYTIDATFKKFEIDDQYDLFYGSEFPDEKIRAFITDEEPAGKLMLLHGPPGTGKSNYLKDLIDSNQTVIYVPPSMLTVLSSPDFIPFMMRQNDTILLIEDAEEVISSNRNSATQNLLNITDGFMADAFNVKIIATFNSTINDVDPALLRKGRLYFEYKFDKLPKEDCIRLAKYKELDIPLEDIDEDGMTLADLFNHGDINKGDEEDFKDRTIGFGQ